MKSVNWHGGEQLNNLAKRFLEGEITERSIILGMAERRAKEHGIL
ncbi:hypothetical protein A2U01_0105214, partial [Trifolium medium]|nr:hypothetical protein [Trifolium medium]